jgi:protein TonB
MNRLQRKCLLASTTLHGLLVLILIVGPAFLGSTKRPPDLPLLEVIPSKLVDAALFGGGTPNATPPQAAPPQPEPPAAQPAPKPPERAKPLKPSPEPELVKAETPTLTTQKPKPKINVTTQITTRSPKETAAAKEREQAEARRRQREETQARQRAARQIEARLSGALRSLSDNLSSSTRIEISGTGGEAFANYDQVIMSIYRKNWIQPAGIQETVIVKGTVVIARDGRVISARLAEFSGNAVVDKSVSEVLQRVKFIAPFPEGTKDESRTFNLDFELKPATLAG